MRLVEKTGCYACHEISQYKGWPKPGPNLESVASKTTKEWAYRWIHNPKSFRHNTWMPTYFHQSNNSDLYSAKRNNEEVHAIVAYLFSKSKPYEMADIPFEGNPEKGKELVASLGCFGCHQVASYPSDTPRTVDSLRHEHGPNLIGLGSKTTKQWIYHWIKNPTSYHPDTVMPDLRLSDQEAADIAAFLHQDTYPEFFDHPIPLENENELNKIVLDSLLKAMSQVEAKEKMNQMSKEEKLLFAGEKLITHYGCYSCHQIQGFEGLKPIGTELNEIGNKAVDKLDFGSVHEIEHTPHAWMFQKLKEPSIFDRDKVKAHLDKLRMPNFYFTDKEAEAIVTFLLGLVDDKPALSKMPGQTPEEVFIQEGQALVEQLNCKGCHIIEERGGIIREKTKDWLMKYEGKSEADAEALKGSFSPPNLIGEGKKVNTKWLHNFLNKVHPIRPWLKVRMPSYHYKEGEVNTIIKYFNYLDGEEFPFEEIHAIKLTPEEREIGQKLFSEDYFGCVQCHIVGDQMPGGSPENWAPDFSLAKERLKPNWIIEWMKDPQGLLPGTKMPTFFDSKFYEYSGPDDILDGDEDRQLEVMRDYMLSLGEEKSTQEAPQE